MNTSFQPLTVACTLLAFSRCCCCAKLSCTSFSATNLRRGFFLGCRHSPTAQAVRCCSVGTMTQYWKTYNLFFLSLGVICAWRSRHTLPTTVVLSVIYSVFGRTLSRCAADVSTTMLTKCTYKRHKKHEIALSANIFHRQEVYVALSNANGLSKFENLG